jgi:DNA-binding response OmpR family regulator
VDPERGLAWVGQRQVRLTAAELRLLDLLLQQPGLAITRAELNDALTDNKALVQERTADVHICALRRKLGVDGLIETVRQVGYRWRGPAPGA